MAKVISAEEARARLDELLDRVERGEEFEIERDGRVVARLAHDGEELPYGEPGGRFERLAGRARGKLWLAPDSEAPLPDGLLSSLADDFLAEPPSP